MDARANSVVESDPGPNGPGSGIRHAALSAWSRLGLPAKLLMLTAAFVLMAEVLIFLPSIATFRVSWLSERLVAAQLAALASEAFPGGEVPSALRADLLRTAQVKAIAARRDGERRLILPVEPGVLIHAHYDLREDPQTFGASLALKFVQMKDAIAIFFAPEGRLIRVIGRNSDDPNDLVEIVIPEEPLKQAMLKYGLHIFGLSVIISALTAALVYISLSRLLVKPLKNLTQNMLRFSLDPEDQSRILSPSGRLDEIGVAERELAQMQKELSGLLAQKNRLAQLGLAVSKINHDLRNMLANAQLISDRLVDIPDPNVQRFVPKLIASLDRAISFCNSSLQFGRVAEPAPRRELFLLKPLVEEVADSQGLPREGQIAFSITIEEGVRIDADREQLFRVLSNLVRNAGQAIETADARGGSHGQGEIRVAAHREGRKVVLDVSDNGPGVPPRAREHMFKAFHASTKKGGSGLGLVIALELVQAHGGSLKLLESETGAKFRIELPDRPVH